MTQKPIQKAKNSIHLSAGIKIKTAIGKDEMANYEIEKLDVIMTIIATEKSDEKIENKLRENNIKI